MDWLTTDASDVVRIALSALGIYLAVIAIIRLNGLRSLAKMSSYDFAVTVAIGSMLASTLLSSSPSLFEGILGIAILVVLQYVVSRLRFHPLGERLVDNTPEVIMVGDRMLDDVIARTRVTPDDIRAKLREANVTDYTQLHCVVLEATGDVSVLHGTSGERLDRRLLDGVNGAEKVTGIPLADT